MQGCCGNDRFEISWLAHYLWPILKGKYQMAVIESVKTVNSLFRTLIFVGLTAGVGYGGYVGYENYVKPGLQAQQALADLAELQSRYAKQADELKASQHENDRLKTSLKLLKVDRRLAKLKVLEKSTNEQGEPILTIRFTEVDDQGAPVGASRDFVLRGERLYVDCWVVKFEDRYIEQSDALRSASLCVFKSIFGDLDGPSGAKSLDRKTENAAPGIYQGSEQSAFEQQIWNDFWNVSNNPGLQKDLGIRASHGEAVYIFAEPGKTYDVKIRSSGATSLEPVD